MADPVEEAQQSQTDDSTVDQSQPSLADIMAQLSVMMEPWDDARMTAFAALLNPLLIGQLSAADARILELQNLVEERNGRIVHLVDRYSEIKNEAQCQLHSV